MSKCPFCKCGKKVFSNKDETEWRCDNCNLVGDDQDDYSGMSDGRLSISHLKDLRMPQLDADAVLRAKKKKLKKPIEAMPFIFSNDSPQVNSKYEFVLTPERAEGIDGHNSFGYTDYVLPREMKADEHLVLCGGDGDQGNDNELFIIAIGNILPSVKAYCVRRSLPYRIHSVELIAHNFLDRNGKVTYTGLKVYWKRQGNEELADLAWIIKHIQLRPRTQQVQKKTPSGEEVFLTKEQLHRHRTEIAKKVEPRTKPVPKNPSQAIEAVTGNKNVNCGHLFRINNVGSTQPYLEQYVIMPDALGAGYSLGKLTEEFKEYKVQYIGGVLYPSDLC